MNRALPTTYDPATFDRALENTISEVDPVKPLFLVVHFELPHWPYSWANSVQSDVPDDAGPIDISPKGYRRAILHADGQVGHLLSVLESSGRLDNAVVAILSDHGEAFRSSEPVLHPHFGNHPGLKLHVGHGTHVLSESQYRVMFAIRATGQVSTDIEPRSVADVTVSLVDLRPTIEDLAGVSGAATGRMEGASLVPLMKSDHGPVQAGRVVTSESGFSPSSILEGNPDELEVIEQTAHFYDVGRDGRLRLASRWLSDILATKQYAAISGRWVLGTLPRGAGLGRHWVLMDSDSLGYWDLTESVDPLPDGVPISALISALCTRYGEAPTFDRSRCPGND
jgi:hypothetical protein